MLLFVSVWQCLLVKKVWIDSALLLSSMLWLSPGSTRLRSRHFPVSVSHLKS